jgi:hypothetical protein
MPKKTNEKLVLLLLLQADVLKPKPVTELNQNTFYTLKMCIHLDTRVFVTEKV